MQDFNKIGLLAALLAIQATLSSTYTNVILVCYAYYLLCVLNANPRMLSTRQTTRRRTRTPKTPSHNSSFHRDRRYLLATRISRQIEHLHYLTTMSDVTCTDQLRMSRDTFSRLCYLLEHRGGLENTKHLQISEQVSIFLSILSHHKKNRVVKHDFERSGYTISAYFNSVLVALLRLHPILLASPTPVDVNEPNTRWRHFTGSLGALDCTYIPVKVPLRDKPRYRNRKGNITVNVLAACDRNMNFTYVLTGWEGSAADRRVLRDAITRPNGLRVPSGNFYLCDGGYTNGQGFLAPYRGVRYHLQDWEHSSHSPATAQEYFNLMHARARNIIERAFGILKARWAILRRHSYSPIKTQNHIILACFLLHNFIRTNTTDDPFDCDVPEVELHAEDDADPDIEYVDQVGTSPEWTSSRDNIAQLMWNEFRQSYV